MGHAAAHGHAPSSPTPLLLVSNPPPWRRAAACGCGCMQLLLGRLQPRHQIRQPGWLQLLQPVLAWERRLLEVSPWATPNSLAVRISHGAGCRVLKGP